MSETKRASRQRLTEYFSGRSGEHFYFGEDVHSMLGDPDDDAELLAEAVRSVLVQWKKRHEQIPVESAIVVAENIALTFDARYGPDDVRLDNEKLWVGVGWKDEDAALDAYGPYLLVKELDLYHLIANDFVGGSSGDEEREIKQEWAARLRAIADKLDGGVQ